MIRRIWISLLLVGCGMVWFGLGNDARAADLTEKQLHMFSQNDILFYNPGECVTKASGALDATGDFADIMNAKNAEKSIFNCSGNIAAPKWSDNNKAKMRELLENYGDLAFRLGKAVGAPYVAILVQMRYEDACSVCGKNNFWGNGCPPGTGRGGASIQGNNLGEGFVQYGQTLTNGRHNQAIGVADPKEYLEKIGPTWVQGSTSGPGYGSIKEMKKSVDALQAYIDSVEGQAIVKTFGGGDASGAIGAAVSGVSSGAGGCDFTKYDYSDGDLKKLAAIAASENGDTIEALKNEMSLMANLYESKRGKGFSSVLDYVLNGKWFGSKKGSVSTSRVSSEELAAARDIFNNGNRTLPKEVDEHDCIYCGKYGYDIIKLEVGGKTITNHSGLKDARNYVKNETVIHNKYGAVYTFYTWANPDNPARSDPMGYMADTLACEPGSVNYCEGGSSAVGEEGLTVEQAKQFMMNYGANKNNSSRDAVGSTMWKIGKGGNGSNCVTFSVFFMKKFTSITDPPSGRWGDGWMVVRNLKKRNADATFGTTPQVFSVVSAMPNHTAVVLGHHDGKWIVGHASYSYPGSGKGNGGDGNLSGAHKGGGSGYIAIESSDNPADWEWIRSNIEFAYPNNVDKGKIERYLVNGE